MEVCGGLANFRCVRMLLVQNNLSLVSYAASFLKIALPDSTLFQVEKMKVAEKRMNIKFMLVPQPLLSGSKVFG